MNSSVYSMKSLAVSMKFNHFIRFSTLPSNSVILNSVVLYICNGIKIISFNLLEQNCLSMKVFETQYTHVCLIQFYSIYSHMSVRNWWFWIYIHSYIPWFCWNTIKGWNNSEYKYMNNVHAWTKFIPGTVEKCEKAPFFINQIIA